MAPKEPGEADPIRRVLIIDDERPIRELLKQILELKSFKCSLASDTVEARSLLCQTSYELILCDVNLPGESGVDFLRSILPDNPNTATIMVTGLDDPLMAEIALEVGVYDYLVKPIQRNHVLISVGNAMRRRRLEMCNRSNLSNLERVVSEKTQELHFAMGQTEDVLNGVIQALSAVVESRNPYTSGHQTRVAALAGAIAGQCNLPEDRIEGLLVAGLVHDLGKIAVPFEILSKPGRLSPTEFNLIKEHPQVGFDILKDIPFSWPIADILLQHHEKLNGEGYPKGLKGENILIEAKILSVADFVETMASHHPYRPALGIEALDEIFSQEGIFYDPRVVSSCKKLFRELEYRIK